VGIALAFTPLIANGFESLASYLSENHPDAYVNGLDSILVRDSAAGFAAMIGSGFAVLLVMPLVQGLLTVSVSRSVIGYKATPAEVWERIRPRIGKLFGWVFLQFAAVVVSTALFSLLVVLVAVATPTALAALLIIFMVIGFIVVLFWVSVRVTLVPAALALEKDSLWTTAGRAWKLTIGSFWRTFGIMLLASMMVGALASILTMPLSMLSFFGGAVGGAGTMGTLAIVTVVTSIITTLVTTAFVSGVATLLYIDLRMRKENLAPALSASANRSGQQPR
jgi:hypothetical protein